MPEWNLEVRKRLAGLNLRAEREIEIIEELSDHLRQQYEELRGRGAGHDEAFREVMAEVDWRDVVPDLESAEKTPRPDPLPEGAAGGKNLFSDLAKDLRFGLRMLRNSPGFASVAVLTLALGIGANTAVFTVVDSLVLNPLPVEKIAELAAVNTTQAKQAAQSGDFEAVSYLNLKDIRDRTRAFRSFAGHSYPMAVTMTDKDEPHRIFAEVVTANYWEIHNLDRGLAVEDMRTGTKVVDQALWSSKIGVGLLGAFGMLALGLASVGLYGNMAYAVHQRRGEIGVRMALGADQRSVSLLVLRQGMTVVASGLASGLLLSLLLGRVLSRFLYGVSGSDPLSLGGASLALLAVAFVACYLPARSASRVDPLRTLRGA